MIILLLSFIVSTALLLAWFYVAMWYLRRMTHIRDEGAIVYFSTFIAVALGAVSDVFYNLTFGTLVFLDIPRLWKGEVTLSQRMKRIRKDFLPSESNWLGRYRYRLASYVCERWLNPQDPTGSHC